MTAQPFNPGNVVKIGQQLIPVATLKDAVRVWEEWRDQSGLGASESPSVKACVDRKLFRISYNGRVWHPSTGAEVIP